MRRSFFIIVGTCFTLVAFQNCGPALTTLDSESIKMELPLAQDQNASETLSSPILASEPVIDTAGAIAPPDLPVIEIASPQEPVGTTTPDPVVASPEVPPVATTPTPNPAPAPAPAPQPTSPPVVADSYLNGEKVLTQMVASIDVPSVIPHETTLQIESAVKLPVPSNTKHPTMTAVFCNAGNIDLQNGDGETFTQRSGMFLGKDSCNSSVALQGLVRVKSRLRIKGNLTVVGALVIEAGGELVVEGDVLHLGESRMAPGLIWIMPGGKLSHKVSKAFAGKAAPAVQYGFLFNTGSYRVGLDAEGRAEKTGKQTIYLNINPGDAAKTDLISLVGSE